MLKIDLPGSTNLFWVEDKTLLSSVENELSHAFYPYAKVEVNKAVALRDNNVFIRIDDLIRIETRNRLISRQYCDVFHAYKSVFSIVRENLQIQDDFAYLHGAALKIGQKTCLLLAETGTGKSTLGVYMDQEVGCTCLTDDLVILQKGTRIISPISKYARIRKESKALLKDVPLMNYNRVIERYEYPLLEKRLEHIYRIDYIFVLHRDKDIHGIQPSSMPLTGILDNMFLPYQIKNNLNSAVEISGCIPTYDIFYQNLETAKNLIFAFNDRI